MAAFYYPWYRNLEVDQYWDHWGDARSEPPLDIASDYCPQLGAYSNLDPAVVTQHFAWLREAGVGVLISSWWGRLSIEEKAVPLLLDMGERYGIKVASHLEPYGRRTAATLVSDIKCFSATCQAQTKDIVTEKLGPANQERTGFSSLLASLPK